MFPGLRLRNFRNVFKLFTRHERSFNVKSSSSYFKIQLLPRYTTTNYNCISIRQFGESPKPKLRYSDQDEELKRKNRDTASYLTAIVVLMLAFAYAMVPLYRVFCQKVGSGGYSAQALEETAAKVKSQKRQPNRPIKIKFNADVNARMAWNFKPSQQFVKLIPGETALAFYTAKNPTDLPVVGVSTYTVVPYAASKYFVKIQCFCFEEQLLEPHEEVDMPVFFYIDDEFVKDPALEWVEEVTLSYTFFESKGSKDVEEILANNRTNQPMAVTS